MASRTSTISADELSTTPSSAARLAPAVQTVAVERGAVAYMVDVARRSGQVDALIVVYLALLAAAAAAGTGPLRGSCVAITTVMLGGYVATVLFARGAGAGRKSAAYAYRGAVLASLLSSYFLLRWLLPTARTAAYDHQLLAIDRALFGVEPTRWLEQWITPARTEWFAAFYLSYFGVLAVHILPMLFFSRRPRLLSEFGVCAVGLWCVGNLTYFVVPGFGPIREVACSTALPSGTIQDFLVATVANAGAQKDIFPSLHTAFPSMFAIFAFRHRDLRPFKYTWPLVAFFAANIIIATMYLRWHYAIDVIAGLALAVTANVVGPRLAAREAQRRRRLGLAPEWPPLP